MNEVLDQTNRVIDSLSNSIFVKNMIENKKIINDNNLLKNNLDLNNNVIHKYIENQNMFDLYIMYMNKEINKLLDNKYCGK